MTPFSLFYLFSAEDDYVIEITLPNLKTAVLVKVIEFCSHQQTDPMTEIEKFLKYPVISEVIQKGYTEFVNLEKFLAFELILASNCLDIKLFLDLRIPLL